MSLYFLDPEREPRECPGCPDCDSGFQYEGTSTFVACDGTGRLGDPDAKPDVEVRLEAVIGSRRWFYFVLGSDVAGWVGPYPTESAALAAAREAHEKRRP